MALNVTTFKTRALTALIFAVVMLGVRLQNWLACCGISGAFSFYFR